MPSHELFKDKTVLITGGTGSFGQLAAKKLLTEYQCQKVIIFSRDEWKQWQMQQTDPVFNHPNIRFFLGDVRDLQRLNRAFSEVDYVIHSAALKQVPAAEYNPSEFVKTNVLGAMNVIEACISTGVKKVIALSTDKACNPVNLYGASKLCSDKLFVNGNSYVGKRGYPIFSVVRYGNVLGTRGSIIPLWKQQLKEGVTSIKLTDKRMTRFWITLEDAVEFVLTSFSHARGGEIFVPKIPSMKLTDLAEAVAPGVSIELCGIREGEKLHEVLISVEDARHSREYDDHYLIAPESYHTHPRKENFYEGREGKLLPEDFSYSSEKNEIWLSIEQLNAYLKHGQPD